MPDITEMSHIKASKASKASKAVVKTIDNMFCGVCIICAFIHVLYLILFIKLGVFSMVLINIGSILLYLNLTFNRFHIHPNRYYFLLHLEVIIHSATAIILFGWGYGFQYILILLFTTIYIRVLNNIKYIHLYGLIEIIILIILKLYTMFFIPPYVDLLPQNISNHSYLGHLIIFCVAAYVIARTINNSNLLIRTLLSQDNHELEELAKEDFLTGLSNRRSLYTQYEYLLDTSKEDFSFCVAIGDIDDFKLINDEYGHEIGDVILSNISKIIKSMTREDDIVCRWGGEEIVIVMPNMPQSLAFERIELIRKKIVNSQLVNSFEQLKPTMTFGICMNHGEYNLEKIIAKADQLLYIGKKSGKNKVVGE